MAIKDIEVTPGGHGVSFLPDNRTLAVTLWKNEGPILRLYDSKTGAEGKRLTFGPAGKGSITLAIGPEGRHVAVGCRANLVLLLRPPELAELLRR
jgi:hypothetical protein